MSEKTRAKIAAAVRHRRERFRRWLAAVRHVPHSRAVWCGDQRCPYAIESVR